MTPQRRKAVVLIVLFLALGTVVAATLALKDQLVESYYIGRLSSTGREERDVAERLVELRSVKAISNRKPPASWARSLSTRRKACRRR